MRALPLTPVNLEENARLIRQHVLTAVHAAQSGHIGSSFSMVEIMTTLLFDEFRINGVERNYFILSKGHAVPCLYAAYVVEGQLPAEQLTTLRQLGSSLQGHPVRGTLPFIDASTGSLGQGLSVGIGYALGSRLRQRNDRVYVVLGDGETQEGQVWEAAMSAVKFGLGSLTAIIDFNELQLGAHITDSMPLEPYIDKWKSFGWYVQDIDGHNIPALKNAFAEARNHPTQPSVIIARTVKGKGVSFMEHVPEWHGKAPTDAEFQQALQEL